MTLLGCVLHLRTQMFQQQQAMMMGGMGMETQKMFDSEKGALELVRQQLVALALRLNRMVVKVA